MKVDKEAWEEREKFLVKAGEAVLQEAVGRKKRNNGNEAEKNMTSNKKHRTKTQDIDGDKWNDILKAHVDNKKEIEIRKATTKVEELMLNRGRWEEKSKKESTPKKLGSY